MSNLVSAVFVRNSSTYLCSAVEYTETLLGQDLKISVEGIDPIWSQEYPAIVYTFEVFFLLSSAFGVGFAAYGLIRILRIAAPLGLYSAFSIPITALTFELISNAIRFIFWLDPVFLNRFMLYPIWSITVCPRTSSSTHLTCCSKRCTSRSRSAR
jgi:hypothetical protein